MIAPSGEIIIRVDLTPEIGPGEFAALCRILARLNSASFDVLWHEVSQWSAELWQER